jgi:3-phenylpropionate/trans-cinnamate dioxygenase ferredoxin subunit
LGEFFAALESSKLSEGSMVAVDLQGRHLLLARIAGQVLAVSGTCTHEESDLGLGFLIEDRVVCALHLSQFDLRTGQVLNPPATLPLQNFNVKIQDGTIFVEV